MAPRTYKIEITVDHMTQTQDKTMDDVIRRESKIILTQAMLLADRRQPTIAVVAGDSFTGKEDIMLIAVDEEEDNSPEGEARAAEGAKTANAAWARSAGYTVADKQGWRFNDPDGKWSDQSFATEAEAWEAAYAITQGGNIAQA